MIIELIWNGIMGASTNKGPNAITLQKDYDSFLFFFSFFRMKEFLNEFFCNLLLKIHIVVSIYHIFVLIIVEEIWIFLSL
jgi:hypothetical protein